MNSGERPIGFDQVKLALEEFHRRMADVPRIPPDLRVSVAKDKRTGESNKQLLDLNGVYLLFYENGELARVGKANPRSFGERIGDYEMNRSGWFVYRWASVIPLEPRQKTLINLLEAFLIFWLSPRENEGTVEE
jgi:hypothetical protein